MNSVAEVFDCLFPASLPLPEEISVLWAGEKDDSTESRWDELPDGSSGHRGELLVCGLDVSCCV